MAIELVISTPQFQLESPKSPSSWVFPSMQEEWLPITESRNGNTYYAAFHTLSSGIGFQALVLPLAFVALDWSWGIICLLLAFMWQLYTIWLLIQLHESIPGTRYSRYLHLAMAAFGEKLGKLLALFPTMYLSGGTCVLLIMIGGGTIKMFFHVVSGTETHDMKLPTTIEWYFVFTCCAIGLAQFPNLNSIAGVSLIGSSIAITYFTLIWAVSVGKHRPSGISHDPVEPISGVDNICNVLNGLGIIALAFRGHNLVLEIQGTMPTSIKHPSSIPMWRAVRFSYLIIAMCLFPLAIGGYWAYGNLIPSSGGMLSALYKYHKTDTPKFVVGLLCLLIVANCLTSFQIYAMPVFDNIEFRYTSSAKKTLPSMAKSSVPNMFWVLCLFHISGVSFLPNLAGLIGAISLPLTLAYPCFMWVMIKKPMKYTTMWCVNWGLGLLGMVLSILLVFGAVWIIANHGIETNFFRP